MDHDGCAPVILTIFCIAVLSFAAFTIGGKFEKEAMQAEAVKHNAARWVIVTDPDGSARMVFKWNDEEGK